MAIDKRRDPFPPEEFRARVAALRMQMEELGAEALLVSDPANICYLSSYAVASAYVPQALLVLADEADPILFLRRLDRPVGLFMAYMDETRVIAYPERLIGNPAQTGHDFMLDWLRARGPVGTLGLEFDALSGATLDALRGRGAGPRMVDLSGVVMRQRLVKSAAEQAVLRQAAALSDHAMQVAQQHLRPGVTEPEVAAAIVAALVDGPDGLWGWPATGLGMNGGQLSGAAHVEWTGATVQEGTHYGIEIGACRFRYAAPLMRTIAVGPPQPRLARMMGWMTEGCAETLAIIRPGVTAGEVAQAYCRVLARGGYEKDTRCGYPIGIDWVESSCSLQPGDPTVLAPGMAFHLMLGHWPDEEFGAMLSESIIITHTGCEVLSALPRTLFQV